MREANVRQAFLAQEKTAMETMKQISADVTKQAREDFTGAQSLFRNAMKSMPDGNLTSLLTVRLCLTRFSLDNRWSPTLGRCYGTIPPATLTLVMC